MTDPDYRALCIELLDALEDGHLLWKNGCAHWVITPDVNPLCFRARAALFPPEPVGPTDEELDELYFDNDAGRVASWRQFARSVLARWGTPANNTREENLDG
jgi:hypothetical protein